MCSRGISASAKKSLNSISQNGIIYGDMKSHIKTFSDTIKQNNVSNETTRKPVLTIKVGAITRWVRDILAIILMWKLIAVIY